MELELGKSMRKAILEFPLQFEKGLLAAKEVSLKHYELISPPSNVIVCGMGGSALPAEILNGMTALNFYIHKSYGLPLRANNGSLIICASYSGNTEETISAFKESLKRKLPVIAITTGGELERLAKENNIPLVTLPGPQMQPRFALGLQFAALAQVLSNHYLIPEKILKDISGLSTLRPASLEKKGQDLAKKIGDRIPLIYTSERLKGLSLFWKNNLNENAKILAFCHYFPEMSHNELVGFSQIKRKGMEKKILPVILKDKEDQNILRAMDASRELIEKEGLDCAVIDISGKNMLETIFSGSLLGLWTSYYLAINEGMDPSPIRIIEEFKKRLKQ